MGMTMTQKILAAHAGLESVVAGQLIEADLLGPLRGATQDTKVLTEELAQIHNLLKVNIPPEALEEYLKRSH